MAPADPTGEDAEPVDEARAQGSNDSAAEPLQSKSSDTVVDGTTAANGPPWSTNRLLLLD